ncbi:MAG: lipoprotein [Bacteroidia bacterium]
MKKILLTALFALALTACSTDNDTETNAIENQHSAARAAATATTGVIPDPLVFECWNGFTAHYDNVGSFANPKWSFIANVPETVTAGKAFKVVLEIQATDGEDITVGYGDIISITDNIVYNNAAIVAPSVTRSPGDLLQWYRWRLKIYSVNVKNKVTCEQTTQWYDNPLG